MEVKEIRKNIIQKIEDSQDRDRFVAENSDNLFNLGLSMYSGNYTIDSAIFNAFNMSELNTNISLHEEQVRVINEMDVNDALIISAPTSFGKTFCVFEYLFRSKPQNVVLIVPTLALAKEYMNVFLKDFSYCFSEYLIHTSIDEDVQYNFEDNKNIFVLTHEKASTNMNLEKLEKIDFLVIDEVYKLDKSREDDRTLIFNIAYNYLSKKSKKYVLLAPFIGGIKNIEELEKQPKFVHSDFSPVVNDVITIRLNNDSERFDLVERTFSDYCKHDKTLIYFPGPSDVEKYINNKIVSNKDKCSNKQAIEFIKWAEKEIHPDWSVVKALRHGYLVHHGKMPLGIRNYLLSIFNDKNSGLDCLLCTSTLLEGVNTSAKNLIISKPTYVSMKQSSSKPFTAFDFYNLVGRTGRLSRYFVGRSFYIKGSDDIDFDEGDANITISFELTEKTKDIDIQINSACDNKDVIDYLTNINITLEEFLNLGTPIRFDTFKKIREQYVENIDDFKKYIEDNNQFKGFSYLNKMASLKGDPTRYPLILKVLSSSNRCVKDIFDELIKIEAYASYGVDNLISDIFKIKYNYLEHNFLSRVQIIKLFLEKEGNCEKEIDYINNYVIKNIEQMYYLNEPYKKMLRSIGVYESDIDIIVNVIGKDYTDLTEMKNRLIKYKEKYYLAISLISRFAVDSIL